MAGTAAFPGWLFPGIEPDWSGTGGRRFLPGGLLAVAVRKVGKA